MERVSVASVCRSLGMSRQNYYAGRQRRRRKEVATDLLVELVRQERQVQPRIGGRKLHRVLHGALVEAGVEMVGTGCLRRYASAACWCHPSPVNGPRRHVITPACPCFIMKSKT